MIFPLVKKYILAYTCLYIYFYIYIHTKCILVFSYTFRKTKMIVTKFSSKTEDVLGILCPYSWILCLLMPVCLLPANCF